MLGKKESVINELLGLLKTNSCTDVNSAYTAILRGGKFNNYLTRSRFLNILVSLAKAGIIEKKKDAICLNTQLKHLSQADLLEFSIEKTSVRWPKTLSEGLQ